ncbi:MAG: acyltransferase family protein [Chryseobacterium sp.]|uniref:acyltransferase n=1 Tax=Chryseobacterium sp. TaxID=1871047 RepID=UPI002FCBAA75
MASNSLQWVHILRAFATFAVIILHCTIASGNAFDIESRSWLTASFINSNVRFCVPIFLMLSGVLLLGKEYSLKEFLQKRMSRIILPFLFWSTIYFFMLFPIHGTVTQIGFDYFKAMKGGTCYHLWYVYMIIGVYLFLPIINKWIQRASKNEILFYLILWFGVLMIDLPGVNRLFTRIDWRYFSGFLGYLILGYYLHKNFTITKNRWIYALIFIAGNLLTFALTYFTSKENGIHNKTFYSYLTPNVIMSSIGVFLLFKDVAIKDNFITKTINTISKYSYGIYLSHVFAMMILPKIGIAITTDFTFVNIFATAFLSLVFALSVTFILNKLPLGKYISG